MLSRGSKRNIGKNWPAILTWTLTGPIFFIDYMQLWPLNSIHPSKESMSMSRWEYAQGIYETKY